MTTLTTTDIQVKLNLGCGKDLLSDHINVDIIPRDEKTGAPYMVHDVTKRLPFEAGTVDHIQAKHLAEHLSLEEWAQVKHDWFRVLKKGGTIMVECPDMVKVCEGFAGDKYGHRWKFWHMAIYGDSTKGHRHKQGFTLGRMRRELEELGFEITRAAFYHDGLHPFIRANFQVEGTKK